MQHLCGSDAFNPPARALPESLGGAARPIDHSEFDLTLDKKVCGLGFRFFELFCCHFVWRDYCAAELTMINKGEELYGNLKAVRAQIACETGTAACVRQMFDLMVFSIFACAICARHHMNFPFLLHPASFTVALDRFLRFIAHHKPCTVEQVRPRTVGLAVESFCLFCTVFGSRYLKLDICLEHMKHRGFAGEYRPQHAQRWLDVVAAVCGTNSFVNPTSTAAASACSEEMSTLVQNADVFTAVQQQLDELAAAHPQLGDSSVDIPQRLRNVQTLLSALQQQHDTLSASSSGSLQDRKKVKASMAELQVDIDGCNDVLRAHAAAIATLPRVSSGSSSAHSASMQQAQKRCKQDAVGEEWNGHAASSCSQGQLVVSVGADMASAMHSELLKQQPTMVDRSGKNIGSAAFDTFLEVRDVHLQLKTLAASFHPISCTLCRITFFR